MKIKGYISIIVFSVLLLSFQSPSGLFSTKTGKISFRSDAPLELISASSDQMYGKFNSASKEFAFSVRVRSFKGFNSKLQEEHFNENYLESGKFPTAKFYGKIIEDINYGEDGTYTVRAKGNLTIHNITQERIIRITLKIRDKLVEARTGFTVLLADHNIPIPKVVHEKLASEIKVDVMAELIRE